MKELPNEIDVCVRPHFDKNLMNLVSVHYLSEAISSANGLRRSCHGSGTLTTRDKLLIKWH